MHRPEATPEQAPPGREQGGGLPDRLALGAVLAFVACFSFVGWLKYRSFAFQDFDLALHAQTLWALLHGSLESSIQGIPFLGNHAHLIFFLLAPAYAVVRHPVALIVLQAAASGWGGWIIYRLARRELPRSVAMAVLSAYLFYPPLGYANLFEFHPSLLAIPLLLQVLVTIRDGQPVACLFWALGASLCQENISFLLVFYGVHAWRQRQSRRWPGALIGGGLFLGSLLVFALIPRMGGGTVDFLKLYHHLGGSPGEIVTTLFTRPQVWVDAFAQHGVGLLLVGLLAPLALLPLLGPAELLLLACPTFLQHLLSARAAEHTIWFHYTAEMIPGIFLATIVGLRRLMQKPWFQGRARWLAIAVLGWALGANLLLGPHLWLPLRLGKFAPDHVDRAKLGMIRRVPPDEGVVATFELLPHLSHRLRLYSFHHVWKGSHTLSDRPYRMPDEAVWAVVDINDPVLFRHRYSIPGFEERLTWVAGFQSPDQAAPCRPC